MIAAARPTLVVVGTGMAGAKVVQEVLTRAPDRFHIRMFGAEPHGTYNRILLSSVLGGFQDPAAVQDSDFLRDCPDQSEVVRDEE